MRRRAWCWGLGALVWAWAGMLAGCDDDDCTKTLTCDPVNQPSAGGGSSVGGSGGSGGDLTHSVGPGGAGGSGAGGAAPSYTAQAVDGGDAHTCALLTDGRVACWGNNDDGQLGDGSFASSPTPVLVDGISDATQIAVGGKHSCALLADKTVWCWGDNENRQLGFLGADAGTPQEVSSLSNIAGVAAGGQHTCAYVDGGEVRCWGSNSGGQVGNGTMGGNVSLPMAVSMLSAVAGVGAGTAHSCALADPQSVFCWGDNTVISTGSPQAVYYAGSPGPPLFGSLLAVGNDAGCVIRVDAVWCWGKGDSGQLGSGNTTSESIATSIGSLNNATTLAGGGDHFCARLQNGDVSCWGKNDAGQIGDASNGNNRLSPTAVSGLSGASAIGLGASHSCAVLTGGAVQCWGANGDNQLGNGTGSDSNVPVPVASFP